MVQVICLYFILSLCTRLNYWVYAIERPQRSSQQEKRRKIEQHVVLSHKQAKMYLKKRPHHEYLLHHSEPSSVKELNIKFKKPKIKHKSIMKLRTMYVDETQRVIHNKFSEEHNTDNNDTETSGNAAPYSGDNDSNFITTYGDDTSNTNSNVKEELKESENVNNTETPKGIENPTTKEVTGSEYYSDNKYNTSNNTYDVINNNKSLSNDKDINGEVKNSTDLSNQNIASLKGNENVNQNETKVSNYGLQVSSDNKTTPVTNRNNNNNKNNNSNNNKTTTTNNKNNNNENINNNNNNNKENNDSTIWNSNNTQDTKQNESLTNVNSSVDTSKANNDLETSISSLTKMKLKILKENSTISEQQMEHKGRIKININLKSDDDEYVQESTNLLSSSVLPSLEFKSHSNQITTNILKDNVNNVLQTKNYNLKPTNPDESKDIPTSNVNHPIFAISITLHSKNKQDKITDRKDRLLHHNSSFSRMLEHWKNTDNSLTETVGTTSHMHQHELSFLRMLKQRTKTKQEYPLEKHKHKRASRSLFSRKTHLPQHPKRSGVFGNFGSFSNVIKKEKKREIQTKTVLKYVINKNKNNKCKQPDCVCLQFPCSCVQPRCPCSASCFCPLPPCFCACDNNNNDNNNNNNNKFLSYNKAFGKKVNSQCYCKSRNQCTCSYLPNEKEVYSLNCYGSDCYNCFSCCQNHALIHKTCFVTCKCSSRIHDNKNQEIIRKQNVEENTEKDNAICIQPSCICIQFPCSCMQHQCPCGPSCYCPQPPCICACNSDKNNYQNTLMPYGSSPGIQYSVPQQIDNNYAIKESRSVTIGSDASEQESPLFNQGGTDVIIDSLVTVGNQEPVQCNCPSSDQCNCFKAPHNNIQIPMNTPISMQNHMSAPMQMPMGCYGPSCYQNHNGFNCQYCCGKPNSTCSYLPCNCNKDEEEDEDEIKEEVEKEFAAAPQFKMASPKPKPIFINIDQPKKKHRKKHRKRKKYFMRVPCLDRPDLTCLRAVRKSSNPSYQVVAASPSQQAVVVQQQPAVVAAYPVAPVRIMQVQAVPPLQVIQAAPSPPQVIQAAAPPPQYIQAVEPPPQVIQHEALSSLVVKNVTTPAQVYQITTQKVFQTVTPLVQSAVTQVQLYGVKTQHVIQATLTTTPQSLLLPQQQQTSQSTLGVAQGRSVV